RPAVQRHLLHGVAHLRHQAASLVRPSVLMAESLFPYPGTRAEQSPPWRGCYAGEDGVEAGRPATRARLPAMTPGRPTPCPGASAEHFPRGVRGGAGFMRVQPYKGRAGTQIVRGEV